MLIRVGSPGDEERQERIGNLEDLIGERGVEHHRHRAVHREDLADVRQADARRCDAQIAGDPRDLAGRVGSVTDHEQPVALP